MSTIVELDEIHRELGHRISKMLPGERIHLVREIRANAIALRLLSAYLMKNKEPETKEISNNYHRVSHED